MLSIITIISRVKAISKWKNEKSSWTIQIGINQNGGKERSGFFFSYEEGWSHKGLISTPHHILDQFRLAAMATMVKRMAAGGGGRFLVAHSTLNGGLRVG